MLRVFFFFLSQFREWNEFKKKTHTIENTKRKSFRDLENITSKLIGSAWIAVRHKSNRVSGVKLKADLSDT